MQKKERIYDFFCCFIFLICYKEIGATPLRFHLRASFLQRNRGYAPQVSCLGIVSTEKSGLRPSGFIFWLRCYKEIGATPLRFHLLASFLQRNRGYAPQVSYSAFVATKKSGLRHSCFIFGIRCYKEIGATPLRFHVWASFLQRNRGYAPQKRHDVSLLHEEPHSGDFFVERCKE
jgi:hypothetical protein